MEAEADDELAAVRDLSITDAGYVDRDDPRAYRQAGRDRAGDPEVWPGREPDSGGVAGRGKSGSG